MRQIPEKEYREYKLMEKLVERIAFLSDEDQHTYRKHEINKAIKDYHKAIEIKQAWVIRFDFKNVAVVVGSEAFAELWISKRKSRHDKHDAWSKSRYELIEEEVIL